MKVRCNQMDLCKKMFPDRDCGAWKIHDDSQCEPCPFSKPGDAKCVYDSTEDTEAHKNRVRDLIGTVFSDLIHRGQHHDFSKTKLPERPIFDEFTPKLKNSVFGSDEYEVFLKDMKVALDHHYKHNRHHPEYFDTGMNGMNLIDLIEMLADWKAAGERHGDGNLAVSILLNMDRERFKMAAWHRDILLRTAEDLGWWDGVMPENCEKCDKPFPPDQDFILCHKCREERVVHTIDRPEVPPQEAEITIEIKEAGTTIEITKPVEEEKDGDD